MAKVNEYAYERSIPSVVAVTGVSTEILARNSLRKGIVVINTGASSVSLAVEADAVEGGGITLPAGAGYEWSALNLTHGSIRAISTGGTTLSIDDRY